MQACEFFAEYGGVHRPAALFNSLTQATDEALGRVRDRCIAEVDHAIALVKTRRDELIAEERREIGL
jgi:hypothetical protein